MPSHTWFLNDRLFFLHSHVEIWYIFISWQLCNSLKSELSAKEDKKVRKSLILIASQINISLERGGQFLPCLVPLETIESGGTPLIAMGPISLSNPSFHCPCWERRLRMSVYFIIGGNSRLLGQTVCVPCGDSSNKACHSKFPRMLNGNNGKCIRFGTNSWTLFSSDHWEKLFQAPHIQRTGVRELEISNEQ